MKSKKLSPKIINALHISQKAEITEYLVYSRLSGWIKDAKNKKILRQIADEEMKHYLILKKYTLEDVKPEILKIWKFTIVSKIFGITFGLKLMENGEGNAQKAYTLLIRSIPEIRKVVREEEIHEKKLLNLIDEERLRYVGSMVLGLNDALVELTGALAGLTFALQDTAKIAFAGFITGIAASLSMAASSYLSARAEGDAPDAVKSSIYTGVAYICTVLFLIFPYLIISNYFVCLFLTLVNAILVILVFNYYIAVARDLSFRKRFFEMAFISLGVAAFTFGVGFVIRTVMGMDA